MSTSIPKNLLYTEEHDWILVEGETATVGITDFAQKSLGDIVYVEMPEVGTTLAKGQTMGVIESIKSVTDLHSPISGEVLARNDELGNTPELCNSNPYESWLVKIRLSNKSETSSLLNPEKYQSHCDNSH